MLGGRRAFAGQDFTETARDAIHAAVMNAHGISQILSFDAGYDSLPGLVRIFE